jgi:hypothetical protein
VFRIGYKQFEVDFSILLGTQYNRLRYNTNFLNRKQKSSKQHIGKNGIQYAWSQYFRYSNTIILIIIHMRTVPDLPLCLSTGTRWHLLANCFFYYNDCPVFLFLSSLTISSCDLCKTVLGGLGLWVIYNNFEFNLLQTQCTCLT